MKNSTDITIFYVTGEPGTLTQTEFLGKNLTDNARVGVDPKTITKDAWDKMKKNLVDSNKELVAVDGNLVDAVSNSTHPNITNPLPPCPSNAIYELPIEFSGKNSTTKLEEVRAKMKAEGADMLLVSELDEVACKFISESQQYAMKKGCILRIIKTCI